ncbi:hypothetical protein LshimejAT787_2500090 [Lyophyllum shimeji]|uniref:Uncharacterized protein n=1 Tax=Lyophyllum shimeji TaxID=47721 RepID=A0A9P3Q2H4_LYOSH|nr:hypothetical protein LshimejAT787_2200830 [Lyophyllum shimeji]GLB45617.1 hypothetical protein LshimejAT787_2500090 [Lyophyllum shimeji]
MHSQNKENTPANVPLQRRPASQGWLQKPSWIDGGVNPPQFYHSHEEINHTLIAYGQPPIPIPLQNVRDALAAMHNNSVPSVPPPYNNFGPPAPAYNNFATTALNDPGPPAPAIVSAGPIPESEAGPAEAPAAEPETPKERLVAITMAFSIPGTVSARNPKPAPKKDRITKGASIVLDGITRMEFIKAFLAVHDLDDQYSPGVHSGPNFKIWWSNILGGKGGAHTIQTDAQFATAITDILAKDKTKKTLAAVSVEFDIDTMAGFRIKQPAPWVEGNGAAFEEELAYGTHVPQVGAFSEASQLHGHFILQLKQKWKCEKHLGEHGEPGYCYVSDNGHLPLNNLRFKSWASALAAGDTTKNHPPNAPEFDGVRDGTLPGPRPRGRMGPYPAAASSAASSSTAAGGSDLSALISVATLGLLKDLTRRKRRHHSSSPPSTPPRAPSPPRAASLVPLPHLQLTACLDAFKTAHNIDLTMHEAVLAEMELTPAIIPHVPVRRLCEVMDVPEGRVHKLQLFCHEWQAHIEEKDRRRSKKPRSSV